MKYISILVNLYVLLLFINPDEVYAADEKVPVCGHVGELVHGDQRKCNKGDLIMVNPMLAAYLCDLTKSHIAGEKIIICHYLGYKRQDRK